MKMACRRNKIAEALAGTMIADVSAEWVNNVWEEDFTQLPQVPQALEDLTGDTMNLGKNLKMTIRELSVASEEGSDQSDFWKILTEQNLKPKALVACLYYFMQRVDQYVSPAEEREVAILAAHLYFAMIGVPGSGAYSIIHPVVFEEAVDIFKLLPSADGVESAKRKRVTSQSQGSKAPRLNQRQKQVVGFDEDSDEDEDDVTALTPQETRHLRSCLLEMLKELVRLILKKSVNDNEQMLNQLVSRLVELTKSTEQHKVDFESRDVASVSSFTQGAFMGLKCLGSTHHTEGSDKMPPLTLVFKYLMPSLLMLMGENEGVAANNIPQQIQKIKQIAVEFVCHMISHMGEKSFGSVRVLLQHMCVTVPEKAEYRTLVSREVVKILQGLPEAAQESFMQWLCKYSQNVKIGYRVFALEVVTILMEPTGADPNVTPIPAGSSNQFLSQKSLLAMLIGRCSDRAPTVRAKALTCLGQFTSNDSPHIALALQELFLNPTSPDSDGNGQRQATEGSSSEIAMDTGEGGTNKDGATPGNLAGGSPLLLLNMSNGGQGYDLQGFLAMVKQRAGDEKVGVRKAALQVLENVSQIDKSKLDEGSLQVIQERCRDPALSVRKQAMVSCTNLLMKHATNESLQRSWLLEVLPLVVDREPSAQEKCLQLVQEAFIDGIVPLNRSNGDIHKLTWSLLKKLTEPELHEARIYLRKACSLWAKQKFFKASLMKSLISHLESEHEESVWMLLSVITAFYKSLDLSFLDRVWREKSVMTKTNQSTILIHILTVIGHLSDGLPTDLCSDLQRDLGKRLMSFEDDLPLIAAVLEALCKLRCSSSKLTVDKAMAPICENIIGSCEEYLSELVLTENATQVTWNEDVLVRYLFTLGHVSQLCPTKTPEKIFMLVQSLLAGPGVTPSADFPSTQNSQGCSQPPLSQFGGNALSMTIRAHTFITLGKLCLQHGGLAKRCIAALARELETSSDAAVRNNVMIVMCDLCIRYPNLVDRYIPNLASCLKDRSLIVRKQTLNSLTHLLLEDYVKWRGPLFFRFLSTLVDDSEVIWKFSEFCLVQLLLKRQPTMLFQHFLEAIFHFNAYEGQAAYNKFTQTDREKGLFSLKGEENASKRMKLYSFMLQHMEDEHRFHVTAKLCQDILGNFVDNVLPLNEDTEDILKDTLTILGCKDIKLTSLKSKNANHDDIVEEMEMAQAVMNQAKNKLISQVVKKNVIENIVPVVIALKQMLVKKRSPLVKHLMLFMKELMKDYRHEIKDILSADRQLASEIEFDLRRFDEQQEAEKQRQEAEQRAVASPNRRPSVGSTPAPMVAKTPPLNRTPKGRTPQSTVPLSPRMVRPPRMKGSPARAGGVTPGRNLVAQAIANSARKAGITGDRRVPTLRPLAEHDRNSQRPPAEGGSKDKNQYSFEESEQEDVKPNVQEIDALIERNRAISTPDKTIMDVTFQAAADLSVIPTDSPVIIPSSFPIRVYGKNDPRKAPGTKSWTPQLEEDQPKRRDNLILMLSPEHPAPKPRKWNVKVSESRNLRVSLTKLHIQGNDGEEADGGSYSKMDTRDKEMEGRLTRRSARLKKR